MTIDDVISGIIAREGGYVDDPADRGGSTKYGITARVLGEWRTLSRAATRLEVRTMPEYEARDIYRARYVVGPGFDKIADTALVAMLVDDGVLSGPVTAVKALQRALGQIEDGVLGGRTLAALGTANVSALRLALVKDRAIRFARIVQRDPSQAKFITGWLTRALDFLDPAAA